MNQRSAPFLIAFLMVTVMGLSSCKKEKDDPEAAEVEFSDQSQDENDFSSETDLILNDIDLALFNNVDVPGGRSGFLCGASIDSAGRTYTITYDAGQGCNGRFRSGSVTLTVYNAQRWSDPGAVLGIEFRGLLVKRVADNRQFNINGNGKIYNPYGGLAREVFSGSRDSLVHRIRLSGWRMNGNGVSIQELHVAKIRRYIYKGQNHFSTVTSGDTAVMGENLVGVWGKNRGNKEFATRYNRPVRANDDCGWYKPVSGTKQHMGFRRTITVTYGVDQSGRAVNQGGAENCAYGYKVEWEGVRGNQTRIIEYK